MFKQDILYAKPSCVGTIVLDFDQNCKLIRCHYDVIHAIFEGNCNLIYSDGFVYDIRHLDIYDWISQSREHFDLTESMKADLKGDTNDKVVGPF